MVVLSHNLFVQKQAVLFCRSVADRLKSGQEVEPENFECVSILFSDIVGFTNITARSSPLQIVVMLNDMNNLLDEIISEYDVYKVFVTLSIYKVYV